MTPHLVARASSLRWKLLLAITGLVVLCTAVLVAGSVAFLHQTLTDRTRADLQRTLTGVSGYMDNQRSDLLGTAKLVSDDPAITRDLRVGHRQALLLHLTPYFADLNADVLDVVNANGRVVVRMENTLSYGDLANSLVGVRSALGGRQTVAVESDVTGKEEADGYSLRATVPIRSGNRIIGAVVVGRQLGSTFAARISHAANADVNLIVGRVRTGTTLTDSTGLPATGLPEPSQVTQRIPSGRMSIAQVHEDGRSVLSGLVPLTGADGRQVGAIEVVRPLDQVNDVIRVLSLLLIALGIVVVILGTALGWNISRRLTSRLQALESSASQVAGLAESNRPLGDLRVPDDVSGNDEIASLGRSFTAMMRALDERMEANAERTRELATLLEISNNVASTLELRPLLDMVLDQLRLVAEYDGATVLLVQDGNLVVLARRIPGTGPAEGPASYSREQFGALLPTLESGQPLAIEDVRGPSPAAQAYREAVGEYINTAFRHERALLAVPMILKDRIVGVLVLTSGTPGFFTERHQAVMVAVASQAAVAIENARLYERAQVGAALEERQRLARELHDSVSQALYGIALGARTARTLLDRDPGRVAEPLEYVLAQAAAGLAEMRALIFELRPEALETEGLVAALEKQVESIRTRHGVSVDAELMPEPDVPFVVKETVYRIAQEALHNTVKHARAARAELRLSWRDRGLELEIDDNGRGFDPADTFPGHLGLKTMRERAAQHRGTFYVESGPETGTRIRVWLPAMQTVSRAG